MVLTEVDKDLRNSGYLIDGCPNINALCEVYMVKKANEKNPDPLKYICKRINFERSESENFNRYIAYRILIDACHPNIIAPVDMFFGDRLPLSAYFIMPYEENLEQYLRRLHITKIPECKARHLIVQLMQGVSYLHWHNIVHRNICFENILIMSNESIQLTGFGYAMHAQERPDAGREIPINSLPYAAPEVVASKENYDNKKTDIWSTGAVLYKMLSGLKPYDDISRADMIAIQSVKRAPILHYLSEFASAEVRLVIEGLMKIEPEKRMTVVEFYKCRWIRMDKGIGLYCQRLIKHMKINRLINKVI